MQFFLDNFNFHNLSHHPHKWLLAFLSSPIHFLELYYKKRYHLNFAHAKKLFVFDLLLLSSIIILGISTIFFFTYDPTVTKLVYLNIQTSENRILSGDYVTYRVNYKNNSNTTLKSPVLKISLPTGLIIDKTIPAQTTVNTFNLPELKANTSGTVEISGWIYGTPQKDDQISATLSYRQEGREKFEEKSTLSIKTLRGSVLKTEISGRKMIMAKDALSLTIKIKNTGKQELSSISIPLPNDASIIPNASTRIWKIEKLASGETREAQIDFNLDIKNNLNELALNFTPSLFINGTYIAQETATQLLTIAHPKAQIDALWQDEIKTIKPDEIANLVIKIKNTGNVELIDSKIVIPLPISIINGHRMAELNNGQYKNEALSIPIKNLKSQEETQTTIYVPINHFPQGGTDLSLSLTPRLMSAVNNIPNSKYEAETESPKLAIASQLLAQAEIRYFTNEGDQLGRGSLPPTVGKETKYWVLINLANGASRLSDINLSATLPSYAQWTGKSSVSLGQDITYSSTNNSLSWKTNSLSAYEKAGIYFEVSFTPSDSQTGTTPVLVKNISVSAHDDYTDNTIEKNITNLDISLPNDKIGQEKGTKVQ